MASGWVGLGGRGNVYGGLASAAGWGRAGLGCLGLAWRSAPTRHLNPPPPPRSWQTDKVVPSKSTNASASVAPREEAHRYFYADL